MISIQASRKKNYLSITVTITATGEDQLCRIFLDLDKIKNVKMVI
jgi:putative lipoic acid-binding regulatory protein